MIDRLVYQALTNASLANYLQNDDLTWRVYPSGSLGHNGIPARPDYPFVQYRESGFNRVQLIRETRRTMVGIYDIWVYDSPGSYVRIKEVLPIVIENLEGIVGGSLPSGWRCTEMLNTNGSEDSYDPITQENSKRVTFRSVVSRDH